MDFDIIDLHGDVAVVVEDTGLVSILIGGEVVLSALDSTAYRAFLYGWRVGRFGDRIAKGLYSPLYIEEAMQWTSP